MAVCKNKQRMKVKCLPKNYKEIGFHYVVDGCQLVVFESIFNNHTLNETREVKSNDCKGGEIWIFPVLLVVCGTLIISLVVYFGIKFFSKKIEILEKLFFFTHIPIL